MKIALLHTAEVHVERFESLLRSKAWNVETVHLVKPELLAMAQTPDHYADLKTAVGIAMAEAEATTPDFVVCTCSTIGQMAEDMSSGVVPCIRIDRPMAKLAVQQGSPVIVLAALTSTLAPTEALIREEAMKCGIAVKVETRLVEGAWAFFEADDTVHYLMLIEQEIASILGSAAVVVLAQASMAEAAKGFESDHRDAKTVPVLASPETGIDYVLNFLSDSGAIYSGAP